MINRLEYETRRQRLASLLAEESIAFIPGAKEIIRNGDVHYHFRQNSNFYYLTGFSEPDALLCIVGKTGLSYLFNRPLNAQEEQWTGKRLGQENAPPVLGISEAFSIDTLESYLPRLLQGKSVIYYPFGHFPFYEKCILTALGSLKKQKRKGDNIPYLLQDLDPILSELRLFKSEQEIALMRKAADVTVAAHKKVAPLCRAGYSEAQIEATLVYAFNQGGCRSLAYLPIVGSGANSCILHYTENNRTLQAEEMVLIDAGGEFENYAADVTRSFPVNGYFNPMQRAIYELVLKAQRAAIEIIKPGLRWNEIQTGVIRIITAGLCSLGLLEGDLNTLIETEAYKPFYMHGSGHWLGLDVHDVGAYTQQDQGRLLQPGMVLTVEPGIYIRPGLAGVDKCWWGIGVRIEDDILVTPQGHENLTGALPVEPAEIEALVRG